MLPPVRHKLLPPPIVVRPDYYREVRDKFLDGEMDTELDDTPWSTFDYPPTCFEPHILALTWDQVLYLLVEINRPGPVTDTSIPIHERPYYLYADINVHYNILRRERQIVVDLQERYLQHRRVQHR